jgi:hypothetical protein
MNLVRICLFLLILGAVRLVLEGGDHEVFFVAIIGFAVVLGFLDRRLKRLPLTHRPAHRQGATVNGLPEDADEGE